MIIDFWTSAFLQKLLWLHVFVQLSLGWELSDFQTILMRKSADVNPKNISLQALSVSHDLKKPTKYYRITNTTLFLVAHQKVLQSNISLRTFCYGFTKICWFFLHLAFFIQVGESTFCYEIYLENSSIFFRFRFCGHIYNLVIFVLNLWIETSARVKWW